MFEKLFDYIFEKILDKFVGFLVASGVLILINSLWINITFFRILALSLFIILSISIFALYKLFKINKYLKQKIETAEVNSYQDLCIRINNLLYQNNKLFKKFSPYDENNRQNSLIEDITLWHATQEERMSPNNKKIKNFIENYMDLIPSSDKVLFEKMLDHIFAFEKHLQDRTIDYSKNQFPKDFVELIKTKCNDINILEQEKISKWIKINFKKKNIPVQNYFFFGSILENYYRFISDIDVLIKYNEEDKSDIRAISQKIKLLEKYFEKKFNKKLHISAFSQLENTEFKDFLKSMNTYKEII